MAVDHAKCNPGGVNAAGVQCTYQCQTDCGRGGYPKIGVGSDMYTTSKAYKCTLCFGRSGADADINETLYGVGCGLPTKAVPVDATLPVEDRTYNSPISGTLVPELKHQPSCVYTCPARAMMWDTRDNILVYMNNLASNGFISGQGDGSIFWASRKYLLIAPKADPFVEDHVTPLMSSLVSGPFAKAALVPTLLAGGLVAVIARRQRLADEMGEV